MNPHDSASDLLYGAVALKNEFVQPTDFEEAIRAWSKDKTRDLQEVLSTVTGLTAETRKELSRELEARLSRDDGDAEICLAKELLSFAASSNHFRWSLEEFDSGGQGVIYKATDDFGRIVVLKVLREQTGKEQAEQYEVYRRAFLREADVTARLQHPNIPPVFSRGVLEDGRPYYAMRLVGGENLWTAIRRLHGSANKSSFKAATTDGRLNEMLRRFLNICDAISYAHEPERNVLHCDLKPENIRLDEMGEPMVLDWGLNRPGQLIKSRTCLAVSERKSPFGTAGYMAPEQAMGKAADVRTDVFGLGALLYAILTSFPPCDGATETEAIEASRDPTPRSASASNPAVSLDLDAICRKAMRFDPEDRYSSATELSEDVRDYLDGKAVSAWEGKEPLPNRLTRLARSHSRVAFRIAGGTFCALLVIIVFCAAVLREQGKKLESYDLLSRLVEEQLSLADSLTLGENDVIDRLLKNAQTTIAFLDANHEDKLDKGPEGAEIYLRKGRISLALGESEVARDHFQGAIDSIGEGDSWNEDRLRSLAWAKMAEVAYNLGEDPSDALLECKRLRAPEGEFSQDAFSKMTRERKRLFLNSLTNLAFNELRKENIGKESLSTPVENVNGENGAFGYLLVANIEFDQLLDSSNQPDDGDSRDDAALLVLDACRCKLNFARLYLQKNQWEDASKLANWVRAELAKGETDGSLTAEGRWFLGTAVWIKGRCVTLQTLHGGSELDTRVAWSVLLNYHSPARAQLLAAAIASPRNYRYKDTLAACTVETGYLWMLAGRDQAVEALGAEEQARRCYEFAFQHFEREKQKQKENSPFILVNYASAVFGYAQFLHKAGERSRAEQLVKEALQDLDELNGIEVDNLKKNLGKCEKRWNPPK